jgi:hypothetical protein
MRTTLLLEVKHAKIFIVISNVHSTISSIIHAAPVTAAICFHYQKETVIGVL